MSTSNYLPKNHPGKVNLMKHLLVRLPLYSQMLGISAEEIEILRADTAAYDYVTSMSGEAHANAKKWTSIKDMLCTGTSESATYPPISLNDAPPPAIVAPGIIRRLTALVVRIKAARNYTEAIGIDLNIVGTTVIVDQSVWQPVLNIHLETGHPVLAWSKGDADTLEIWVERSATTGFTLLEINTSARYTDTAALPAVPTQWRYKAVYRVHNAHAGEWSAVVAVLVGG